MPKIADVAAMLLQRREVVAIELQLLCGANDAKGIVVEIDVVDADRVDDLEPKPLREVVAQLRRAVVDYELVVGDPLKLPGADVILQIERMDAAAEDVLAFAGAVGAPVHVGRAES